jgi:ubiquinone/menaquinone biosynthesis C-methylase UbiE
MKLLDRIHGSRIFPRRVSRLKQLLDNAIPAGASVLDVGCGDGSLAAMLLESRPDLSITGLEVLARPATRIPVQLFDGTHIPFEDRSFDIVMFVDVLHHTVDPMVLLREAARVARLGVVIKDHVAQGLFAKTRLRLMDYVGNARHGVSLPYNYWTEKQWREAQSELGIKPVVLIRDLGLYPTPADAVFGANLHFVGRFEAA